MKNILYTIILSFLFSSVCLAEIYYCAEEASTGFENANSRKPITFQSIKRFTIEIKDGQAYSESILFHPDLPQPPCIINELDDGSTHVSCTNWRGFTTFTLNLNTMVFSLSYAYITNASEDSVFISLGNCEKFN